jgi:hypothetical protein
MLTLQQFMDRVETSDEEVAEATGLHRTTIYRVRSGIVTDITANTMRRIDRWAKEISRAKRLTNAERLDWDEML